MSGTADKEPDASVTDAPPKERYELEVDGVVVAFARYRPGPAELAFVHTEVGEAWGGRGLGSRLIRFALDDARDRDLAVLPFCPFVNGFIRRHPEYTDLVPEGRRRRFGL